MKTNITKRKLEKLTYEVIGAAIEVHKHMGGGLLESVYKSCMKEELNIRGLNFRTEMAIPLFYKGKELGTEFRCDMLIDNCLVVEYKSVSVLNPIFEAQVLSYMRLLEAPKGLIINFCTKNIFHKGQKTFVNEHFRQLPDE